MGLASTHAAHWASEGSAPPGGRVVKWAGAGAAREVAVGVDAGVAAPLGETLGLMDSVAREVGIAPTGVPPEGRLETTWPTTRAPADARTSSPATVAAGTGCRRTDRSTLVTRPDTGSEAKGAGP